MGQIIQLTATSRNGKTISPAIAYGFDIDDIAEPIKYNPAAKNSIVVTRGIIRMDKDSKNVDKVIWTVQENLATIAGFSAKLLNLTVIRRRRNTVASINYIFNASRIQEVLTITTKGVKFMYNEDGDPLPVEYEVSNSLASIVSISAGPPIPVLPVKKIYKATLTQPGGGLFAPVATVLENNLGAIVYSYGGAGYFVGTLVGAFPDPKKVSILIGQQYVATDTGGIYVNREVAVDLIDADSFFIETGKVGSFADGVLNNLSIQIEVYP